MCSLGSHVSSFTRLPGHVTCLLTLPPASLHSFTHATAPAQNVLPGPLAQNQSNGPYTLPHPQSCCLAAWPWHPLSAVSLASSRSPAWNGHVSASSNKTRDDTVRWRRRKEYVCWGHSKGHHHRGHRASHPTSTTSPTGCNHNSISTAATLSPPAPRHHSHVFQSPALDRLLWCLPPAATGSGQVTHGPKGIPHQVVLGLGSHDDPPVCSWASGFISGSSGSLLHKVGMTGTEPPVLVRSGTRLMCTLGVSAFSALRICHSPLEGELPLP